VNIMNQYKVHDSDLVDTKRTLRLLDNRFFTATIKSGIINDDAVDSDVK